MLLKGALTDEASALIAQTERSGGGIVIYDENDAVVAANAKAMSYYGFVDLAKPAVSFDDIFWQAVNSGILWAPEAYQAPAEWLVEAKRFRRSTKSARHVIRHTTGGGERIFLAHNIALESGGRAGIRIDVTETFPSLVAGAGSDPAAEGQDRPHQRPVVVGFGMAVGVVTLDGLLIDMNETMQALIEEGDGLRIVGGRVAGTRTHDTFSLMSTLRHLDAGTERGAVRLERSSGRLPLVAILTCRPLATPRVANDGPGRLAVMTIADPAAPPGVAPSTFSTVYDLTPDEAHLACSVAAGLPALAIAIRDGIDPDIVQLRISALLAKLNCDEPAALVRKALDLSRVIGMR